FVVVALLLPESLPREYRRRQSVRAILKTYGEPLRDLVFIGYVLAGGFMFAGLLTYITGSPFVFIEIFHVPPERFGLFFGTNAFGIIAGSQVNRWLAGRMDTRRIVGTMLVVAMTSSLVLLFDAWGGFGGFAG